MDLQLTGRTVVVSGASRGIGVAVARAALDEGARVVAASRTLTPELEALAGPDLVHVAVDLLAVDAPAELLARAVEAFGGVDVLVNNLGVLSADGPHGSFLDVSDAAWQATLDANLLATIRLTRAALPLLLESSAGAIVNLSSVNARRPFTMVVDYSAAKAALSNLGKALSEEFAPRGVRVNTVSPGPVRTPMWEADGGAADAMAAQAGVDRETALLEVIPQAMGLSTGSMATPEEVAALVLLLASPVCANVTGADWTVDSGFLKAT